MSAFARLGIITVTKNKTSSEEGASKHHFWRSFLGILPADRGFSLPEEEGAEPGDTTERPRRHHA